MAFHSTETQVLPLFPVLNKVYSQSFNTSFETGSSSSSSQLPKPKQQDTPVTAPNDETTSALGRTQEGTNGILSMMMDMPLDIILEIFGHLLLVDLLRVARTTNALRSFVLSRSSIGLRKRAFANLPSGLPPCPSDMSEPSFAALLFDEMCHVCFGGTGNTIEWVLRKRFCNTCLHDEFVEGTYHTFNDPRTILFTSLVPKVETEIDPEFGWEAKHMYHRKSVFKYYSFLEPSFEDPHLAPANITQIAEMIQNAQRRAHGKLCSIWLSKRRYERCLARWRADLRWEGSESVTWKIDDTNDMSLHD